MFNNFGQYPVVPTMSSYGQIASGQCGQMPNYYANMQQQNQGSSQQTNITFVNGIEGAKAFQMSPNASALLMDSDNCKFYVKSTDNLGVAKITSYSFVEDEISSSVKVNTMDNIEGDNISKEKYDMILNKITELEEKMSELSTKINELL